MKFHTRSILKHVLTLTLLSLWITFCATADNPQITSQGPKLQVPGLTNTTLKLEDEPLITQKLSMQSPIRKGTLSQFAQSRISLGKDKTESLGNIAQAAFAEQNNMVAELQRIPAAREILAEAPEIKDEVYEFQDSYAIVKNTSIIVVKPIELHQAAPSLKNSLGILRPKGQVNLSQLKPKNLQGFRSYVQNEIPKLTGRNPLKAASTRGEEALFQAMADGQGRYTRTSTLIVPKTPYPVVNGLVQLPFQTQKLQSIVQPAMDNGLDDRMRSQSSQTTQEQTAPVETPSFKEHGKASFQTQFFSGFTKGNTWDWEDRWDYPSGFFRITLGARYGIGLRIPIEVKGDLSPTNIELKDVHDREVETRLKVSADTKDANVDFYRKAGMPEDKIFDAKELVLEFQFGYGYKLRALWTDLAYRAFHYYGYDNSQNFKPPMGNSHEGPTLWIPTEITQTRLNLDVGVGRLNLEAQIGFKLTGDGNISLDYEPFIEGKKSPKEKIKFSNASPVTKTKNLSSVGESKLEQKYGFTLTNPSYKLDPLKIIPAIRLSIDIDAGFVDESFHTGEILLNGLSADLGTLTFGRHKGTRKEFKYSEGKKKLKTIEGWSEEIREGSIISLQSESNGKFVRAGLGNVINCYLGAKSPHGRLWEAFRVKDLGNGKIALQLIKNGMFVRVMGNDSERGLLSARENHARDWETFKLIPHGEGLYALQCVKTGKYIRPQDGDDHLLKAVSSSIGPAEIFRIWPAENAIRELPAEGTKPYVGFQFIKNGKFVSARLPDMNYLGADSPVLDIWEAFKIEEQPGGLVAIKCVKNGKYIGVQYTPPHYKLNARGTRIDENNLFELKRFGQDKAAFHIDHRRGGLHGFIKAGIGNECLLGASSRSIQPGESETFRIVPIEQARTTSRSQWEQGGSQGRPSTSGGTSSNPPPATAPPAATQAPATTPPTTRRPAVTRRPVVTQGPMRTVAPAAGNISPRTTSSPAIQIKPGILQTRAPILTITQAPVQAQRTEQKTPTAKPASTQVRTQTRKTQPITPVSVSKLNTVQTQKPVAKAQTAQIATPLPKWKNQPLNKTQLGINSISKESLTAAKPSFDLMFDRPSFAAKPATKSQSSNRTLTFTIRNKGSATSAPSSLQVRLKEKGRPERTVKLEIPSIKPNQATTLKVDYFFTADKNPKENTFLARIISSQDVKPKNNVLEGRLQ